MFAHLSILKNMEIFAPITDETLKQLNEPSKLMMSKWLAQMYNF